MISRFSRFALIVALLALSTSLLWAQAGTGEITGLVTDPQGAVVTGASVDIVNQGTGEKRSTHTTGSGIYRFTAMPVGTYTLTIDAKDFQKTEVRNVNISVALVSTRDVTLKVGAAGTEITVEEGGAAQVDSNDAQVSTLLDKRVWQQLPLEVRSQNEFIGLLPGANAIASNDTGRGNAVNGARTGAGNFMVEGFDNNDQGLGGGGSMVGIGGAVVTISPDAIQEFRVISNNYSAEYGKAGGFVTDTVLKGGTNQWHGSAFEYNRIQLLAANNFFSNRAGERDHLVRNQFGGSIGGPIVKDKTFIYGSIEWHRLRLSTPATTTATTQDFLDFVDSGAFETFMESDPNGFCVLNTGAACAGAFANSATLGPIFSGLLATQPFPLATDPSTFTNFAAGCQTGDACGFGFAQIVYPVPVYGQVTVANPQQTDQVRWSVKFDHHFSDKNSIDVHWLFDDADSNTAVSGSDATLGVGLPQVGRAQNGGIGWSHIFTPALLNQFKLGYVRHTANFPGDAAATAAGIPSIVTAFDPLGVAFGNASNLPQFFTDNQYSAKVDMSWVHGKHSFKWGGEYRRTANASQFDADFFGLIEPYDIESLVTDLNFGDESDLAVFGAPLLGSAFALEASIDPTVLPTDRPVYARGYRANEFATYVQDDWRIHPRLTLNLGVRWEYFGPPHNNKPGLDSNFYFGPATTPITTTSTNPFFPTDNPSYARVATGDLQQRDSDIWAKDWNNFSPRFGFAFDMFGDQKVIMRGGYGIMYDRMYNNIFENIRFNPPHFCFCSFGAFVNGVPAGALSSPGVYTVPFNTQSQFSNPLFAPVPTPRHMDENMKTAYYQQYNFGFQFQLFKDYVLETNYIGSLGRDLLGILNINTFNGRTTPGLDSTRPNANIGSDNFRTNAYGSNYSALQVTLRKSYSYGLSFNANYTYGKALDEYSDVFNNRTGTSPTNTEDIMQDYGPADFDVRHRFVTNLSYDLPFFKTNNWIGGWTINTIVTAQTGQPFSVLGNNDRNRNGITNDRATYIGTGSIANAYTGGNPADGFIDASLFQRTICDPADVGLGLWCQGGGNGSSRNALTGPGLANVDFGLAKSFKITERMKLTFMGNFFNVFNHTNFYRPNFSCSFLGAADNRVCSSETTFGKSTTTSTDPRITQLALRFDF
jgi:hypothetical protein